MRATFTCPDCGGAFEIEKDEHGWPARVPEHGRAELAPALIATWTDALGGITLSTRRPCEYGGAFIDNVQVEPL